MESIAFRRMFDSLNFSSAVVLVAVYSKSLSPLKFLQHRFSHSSDVVSTYTDVLRARDT